MAHIKCYAFNICYYRILKNIPNLFYEQNYSCGIYVQFVKNNNMLMISLSL